ncbi:MAG: Rrf2 family transcriptional regulator [Verrucomicrobia bacterium]|nr:Rrf2 family transcriptional regulator [Verrucomicrobiota bacterium]
MRVSVKADYAVRAVFGLAGRYAPGAVRRVEELAAEQGIPPSYLVQILLELKAAHLVKSQRGKDGGYQLARPPGEITFGDVLRAVQGELFSSPAVADPRCAAELRDQWASLQRALENAADAVTFQDLVERSRERDRMYYI